MGSSRLVTSTWASIPQSEMVCSRKIHFNSLIKMLSTAFTPSLSVCFMKVSRGFSAT